MTPRQAYRQLVLNEVEKVPLDGLADRVVATGVVPYPPGIPMLMPGESAGAADGPYLSYLRALQSWDKRFPGFGTDIKAGIIKEKDAMYQLLQCFIADYPTPSKDVMVR